MPDPIGTGNIIVIKILIATILVIAGLWWWKGSSNPLPIYTPPSMPTTSLSVNPAPNISGWKMYENIRYSYAIKYPPNWFIDISHSEEDFSERGPIENRDWIGGDITWSNIDLSNQKEPPSNLQAITLLVYKTDNQTTLDDFIKTKNWSYYKKQDVKIDGVNGLLIFTKNPENLNEVSKTVLFKTGGNIFHLSGGNISNNTSVIMEEMLFTFRFIK